MAADRALVMAMLSGALVDPVLWVIGAVIGWDHRRAVQTTAALLVAGGLVWGAVRVGVYTAFGEALGASRAALLVLICVALMVALGLAVREGRWLLANR